jgi:hypothetical protein
MRHYWDPVPTNRPTAVELWDYFYEIWEVLNNKYSIIKISENHKEKFTREQKNKWKAILVKLATNPLKKSQNMLTSKRLLSLKIGT